MFSELQDESLALDVFQSGTACIAASRRIILAVSSTVGTALIGSTCISIAAIGAHLDMVGPKG